MVFGGRAHVFGVTSTAVAARSLAGLSYARQRRLGRVRWPEGVERSAAFLVLKLKHRRLVMTAITSRCCLTRVMTDDDRGVEVAQLQSVLQRIQSSLQDVPEAHREYIAGALLSLAVSRIDFRPKRVREQRELGPDMHLEGRIPLSDRSGR